MSNTPKLRISRSYRQGPDDEAQQLAEDVIADLTGNPGFTTPPAALAQLPATLLAFKDARTAMAQGGPADTAFKNQKRLGLEAGLDPLANYVEDVAPNNLALILSTGFHVISTNHAQVALEQPVIKKIDFGMPGELLVTVEAMANVHMFMVYAATDAAPNDFVLVGYQKGSRKISCHGLTPGVTYHIHVQALGGSTGLSPFSDTVLHLCI